MKNSSNPCDVFISHPPKEATLASVVAQACRDAGLETLTNFDLDRGRDAGDLIWEALAESNAFLAIVSPSGLSPTMAVELGAARARLKPIYVIVTDPASTRVPAAFGGAHVSTLGNLPDVIRAIRLGSPQLSDEDRDRLVELYREQGISSDQLAMDPAALDLLMKRFEASSGQLVAGERLLTELERLRKQGKLAKTRRKGRMPA